MCPIPNFCLGVGLCRKGQGSGSPTFHWELPSNAEGSGMKCAWTVSPLYSEHLSDPPMGSVQASPAGALILLEWAERHRSTT